MVLDSMAAPTALRRPRSVVRLFFGHPLAIVGLCILVLLTAIAVLAPVISRGDPLQSFKGGIDALGVPHRPGDGFLLGADTLGRDVWTRAAFGARISLIVAVCAMITSTLIGTVVGLVGGYFGGWIDAALTRITEVITSLPTILLAITLAFVLPDHLPNLHIFWQPHFTAAFPFVHWKLLDPDLKFFRLLFAIGLVTWTNIARAVRGQTLALKERDYLEAARAVGCSQWTIIRRHLLPGVLPTVIALATLNIANNILLEAGLSYLNLGLEPSAPSWGGMIAEGQPYLLAAPWISLVPGIAIVLAVSSFNMLGTALEESLVRGR
jgi:ABC-type dipeptide/oligopeptide/nickel transport system permease subunit